VAGSDPGVVCHGILPEQLRAALVLAPEVPLEASMAMLPACGVGFQNALGSLAPPEVSVHLEWPGAIRVNGARCGRLRAAASTHDPLAEPDWLVVGLEVTLSHVGSVPGDDPDQTALNEEGCVEVDPLTLLEAWVRHTLYWINRWTEEGVRPLQTEWRGLAHDLGKEVGFLGVRGLFVGLDEHFGALVRDEDATHPLALHRLLEP
jgi:biotin-(acetyl-CoA carboxylase) ligase